MATFASFFATNKVNQSQESVEVTRLTSELESLQSMFQSLSRSNAIIEFEPTGVILSANDNFLSVTGYSRSEIVGRHHRMFVAPSYANSTEYRNFWSSLAAGEYLEGEFCRVGKNGKDIWIQASYNPVMDANNNVKKIIKIASDITAKKHRDAELLSQIQIVDRSYAVIEFNLDGTVRSANELFLKTVGYSLPEVQGKHHRMFVDPAEQQSEAYKNFWIQLNRGTYHQGLFKRVSRSGSAVWIRASYNPIFNAHGDVNGFVKYAIDVTNEVGRRQQTASISEVISTTTSQFTQTINEISQSVNRTAGLSQDASRLTTDTKPTFNDWMSRAE